MKSGASLAVSAAFLEPFTPFPHSSIHCITKTAHGSLQRRRLSEFDPLGLQQLDRRKKEAETGLPRNCNKMEETDNSIYKAMLLVVSVLWGSNFIALKYLDSCGVEVSVLTAMRFLLASVALAPTLRNLDSKGGWPLLRAGLEIGLFVGLGYVTQAIGLETTEASTSAFICSLTVVTIPVIQGLLGRKVPRNTWLACGLAIVGVGLLTLEGRSGQPTVGDLWSLGQPIGFGIAFMRIEHHMRRFPGQALPLAAAQMLSVFVLSALWAALQIGFGKAAVGDLSILLDPAHAASLAYTGLVTSAFAVVLESIALAHVPATETAVIFSTEPLWAATASALILGERLKPPGMLGGFAILSACLLTQLDLTAFAALLPFITKFAEESSQVSERLQD